MAPESGWLQIEPKSKEIVVVKDSHPITAGWKDMKCRFFQKHQLGPPKFSFLTPCPKFLPSVSLWFHLITPPPPEKARRFVQLYHVYIRDSYGTILNFSSKKRQSTWIRFKFASTICNLWPMDPAPWQLRIPIDYQFISHPKRKYETGFPPSIVKRYQHLT